MAKDHLNLNKISNVGDSTITSLMKDNVIEFFGWAILNNGGFFNISIPTPPSLFSSDRKSTR